MNIQLISKQAEMKEFAFDIPANAEYVNKNISITLGMNGTTWLDNVSLVENALIKMAHLMPEQQVIRCMLILRQSLLCCR